jgi:hypothetical protein
MPTIRAPNLRRGQSSKCKEKTRKVNQAFRKKGMTYSGKKSKQGTLLDRPGGLRHLETQMPFEKVSCMDDAKSKAFLQGKKVVLATKPKTVKCWCCGEKMEVTKQTKRRTFAKQVWRCANRSCSGNRPRLYGPATAFTPLQKDVSAGYDPKHKEFTRYLDCRRFAFSQIM